jgi:hypothetical protein
MDSISWSDLTPAEQRAIAVLGAGISIELCDAAALQTLRRARLVKGSQLTAAAERLRQAAVLTLGNSSDRPLESAA